MPAVDGSAHLAMVKSAVAVGVLRPGDAAVAGRRNEDRSQPTSALLGRNLHSRLDRRCDRSQIRRAVVGGRIENRVERHRVRISVTMVGHLEFFAQAIMS